MNNQQNEFSMSDAFIKHIDYGSEEWVKQLLMEVTNNKVATLKPFVGSVSYPSRLFPNVEAKVPTLQFAQTTYVGLMQMIFPVDIVPIDDLPSFTVVEFILDGIKRTFCSVAGDGILSANIPFSDFVNSLYPTANDPVPFCEAAYHVLSDVSISGSKFNPDGTGGFISTGFVSGAHTNGFKFCISVSGYSAVIQ
jgi:hypothetical protein